MGDKTIVQLAVYETGARRIYDALTRADQHAAFTGSKATGEARVGGGFTAYDGYITGSFIELDPGRKIVQTWRASDWPENAYSTVTIELVERRDCTTLHLTQERVPEKFAEEISQGWHGFYWDRLRTYLEKST